MTTAARILVIDDEPQIRRFLDISLRTQGYLVLHAADASTGLATLATEGAELVILDLGLPDRDGLKVLADLRQWSQVPVLVLTARDDEAEKVAALDAGANDYVTKPFGVQELMARLRALLRTQALPEGAQPPVFDDGTLRVDLARREVRLHGELLHCHARNTRCSPCWCATAGAWSPNRNCSRKSGAPRTSRTRITCACSSPNSGRSWATMLRTRDGWRPSRASDCASSPRSAAQFSVNALRGSFSGRIAALYANEATIADACFRSSGTMWSSTSRSLWWTLVK